MYLSRGIRRSTVTLLTVVAALSFSVTTSHADAADPRNRDVSGAVTGTSAFDFLSHGCALVYQRFDLTFVDDKGGVGTLEADTCGNLGLVDGELIRVVEGPFELVTAKGAVLTGDLAGVVGDAVPPFPAPFPSS